MITRCTACDTWFQVAPESLEVVHGLVRCGSCGKVFNAAANLREKLPADYDAQGRTAPAWVHAPLAGTRGSRAGRWLWAAAAALLVLALAAQLINADRRAAAAWPVAGPAVDAAYRLLGRPLAHPPFLGDFSLRDTSLSGGYRPGAALALQGTLVNRAKRAQPLPLLELQLTDRFGAVVASRLLEPAEYGAPASVLPAGTGLALDVKLADPGPRAVGFTLAVCKRVGGNVRCRPS